MNAMHTVSLKMLASFNQGIFIPIVAPADTAPKLYERLKERGARMSLPNVERLINGAEGMINGFEVVTVSGHHVPGEAQPRQTTKPAATKPKVSPAPAVSRGRAKGREYPPVMNVSEVKPAKRGALYSRMLELLKTGATTNDLLSITTNRTPGGVNDVLSWQVKNLGYGLKYDSATERYTLVFPKGVKDIVYRD